MKNNPHKRELQELIDETYAWLKDNRDIENIPNTKNTNEGNAYSLLLDTLYWLTHTDL